jgi:MFS family permease
MDNRFRLLVASFLTLIAAGMGFAIRNGGILGEWGAQFGFTKTDLGEITGMGLTGFGITIIFFSLFTDRIGYKAVLVIAFLLHVLSSVLTYMAIPMYDPARPETKETVKWLLSAGAFAFALANGTCEAVINPLVATLYSKQKTHYLNILHAGWPGGLILGGLL